MQALPEGRRRRGDHYPQWLLLLMAILSGCRSARDLEPTKAPCDSTFLYLFERMELEGLFGLLREWMIAQIANQGKNFDQLICDGKTLRGSAAQPDGATLFVIQVTLYAREMGVAIAQTSLDTGESHERAALRALLSNIEL